VPLLLAALGVVAIGAALPATPFARALGFRPLPGRFFLALALMVACYLVLIEIGKRWFYRSVRGQAPGPRPRSTRRRIGRRARRFSTRARLARTASSGGRAVHGVQRMERPPGDRGEGGRWPGPRTPVRAR